MTDPSEERMAVAKLTDAEKVKRYEQIERELAKVVEGLRAIYDESDTLADKIGKVNYILYETEIDNCFETDALWSHIEQVESTVRDIQLCVRQAERIQLDCQRSRWRIEAADRA